ncbi:serine/threonine-protein kinase [Nostoc sp. TCL26-01]|uniref:serine/threonine-protein kinase n=1 Tax=Nostoc sp. TCL26-01 TaxID=2576904 RepID=UPI0015C13997|nr:serine/threonine-protein kinase [Nostoc sp. TCL26-01]QLE59332.1 serine/threonine protein kinase [Nostoc sp. TCL26-01]
MLGKTVGGRYQILTQLGGGGFSTTFIAQDTQRPGNPQCVVKHFKPLSNDEYTLREAKRLFHLEAATLERLGTHNQIPQLLAHFSENQEFYLVQELIVGHDLSQELPPVTDPLPETEVIKLLKEILEVLSFVHQQNVIHRDIKPANIRRRKSDGKIVLIDFGAVKQISAQRTNVQGETNLTVAIGTPGYMPSEQANQVPKLSSDIYAVGIIGIQALTGINFPNFGSQGLPRHPNTGEIDWRNQAPVSPKLANIIDKMVRYDFRQRYQSADEALQAIQRLSPKPLPWKTLIGVGIIALIIPLSLLIFQAIAPKDNFLNYENSSKGIKLRYPQNWQRQDIENVFTQELVTFLSPKENDADKFTEKLTVNVGDFAGTLDESKDLFIKEIKNTLTDANVISTTTATMANKQAYQLVYTGKNGDVSVKNLQIWTLKNDKAYVITYTANVEDYDKFLPIAEKMIQSLEIE